VTTSGDALAAPAGPTGSAGASPREQTRARYPDEQGYVDRSGVRIFWERYGEGDATVLLLPTWSIVHSRCWKFQIPYLARYCRVITFDGRGNGRSDRPLGAELYTTDQFAADALAVMDATGTASASLVALSCGALWATVLAAEHPERVERIAYIAPAVALAPGFPEREQYPFDVPLDTDAGWAKYNADYWQRDYPGFLEFFSRKAVTEPRSSKAIEDFIGWANETTPEVLADTMRGIILGGHDRWLERCERVRCPTLVIHGDGDLVRPHAQGAALAEVTGGQLVTLSGGGHVSSLTDPVKVNLILRDFLELPRCAPRRWVRAASRPRRALYVSSPIGLGHARRDLAIADELRTLYPDLEIDWLAQPPVTSALQLHGERIHPASAQLAGESAHIQSESDGHDLQCFQALRRMDEILLANFMVFLDVVQAEPYDVWIGDEAWDLDYYLHENPELKSAAYVWLTDFVGYLPMPDGGQHEAFLTADHNAEMIEQIAHYPRVRDRAIFVGEPDDIVPDGFGDGLPAIRDWTEEQFSFSGYITGFEPSLPADRPGLRAELGYSPSERVCVVTVGGSGVGTDLLRRVIAAFPEAKGLVPDLRMIVVAGPRIDPGSLPLAPGLEIRAYVPDLHRHLAACDLAVVQGGLTTGMELIANRRPFLYFPLRHHFEQCFHVAHRFERYGATGRMEFDDSPPEAIAAAIAREIDREPNYRAVATDGAARAAAMIASLL
jgi:pimeloyl-ACP methyl ester carboxylesterase/predicted glycosyltransferase